VPIRVEHVERRVRGRGNRGRLDLIDAVAGVLQSCGRLSDAFLHVRRGAEASRIEHDRGSHRNGGSSERSRDGPGITPADAHHHLESCSEVGDAASERPIDSHEL
jgi:hypothetical protein